MTGDEVRARLRMLVTWLDGLEHSAPEIIDIGRCTVAEGAGAEEWAIELEQAAGYLEELSTGIHLDRPPPPGKCAGVKDLDAAVAKVFTPERVQALAGESRPELLMVKKQEETDAD